MSSTAMTSALFDLSNKVAVVSGAAQGMGRAMATALAEAGAQLLLVDRNEAGVQNTAREINDAGGHALPSSFDISDTTQVRALFALLDSEFGRIDFLGNVAGESIMGAPEDIALEDVEQVFRNLVIGRFCACQEAGRPCSAPAPAPSSTSAPSPA